VTAALPADGDRLAGRNGEAWRLYTAGLTQEAIGKRLGLDQSVVSRTLAAVRAGIPVEEREDWRLRALEALYEVHAATMEIIRADPPPAFHQGDVLHDEHDQVVRDASTRLAAIGQLLRIQERTARALGTDAPEKVQVASTVHYTVNGVNPESLR
jgi:hypothetical protein